MQKRKLLSTLWKSARYTLLIYCFILLVEMLSGRPKFRIFEIEYVLLGFGVMFVWVLWQEGGRGKAG
jgi:hypothetical protein